MGSHGHVSLVRDPRDVGPFRVAEQTIRSDQQRAPTDRRCRYAERVASVSNQRLSILTVGEIDDRVGDQPRTGIADAHADNPSVGQRQDDRRTLTAGQSRILIEVGEERCPVDTSANRADRIDDRLCCRGPIAGAARAISERDDDVVVAFEHTHAVLSATTGRENFDDVCEPACWQDRTVAARCLRAARQKGMVRVMGDVSALLRTVGLSPAEYAVLWHVRDTVVQPRDVLASWTADNLPNNVPSNIAVDDCVRAIEALVGRALLVELTAEDIVVDLARWRAEELPVSWGVDRDRYPGDIDLTEAGFRVVEDVTSREFPDLKRSPVEGYDDTSAGTIRVFGETEDSCRRAVTHVLARIGEAPWRWPAGAVAESLRPLGPWWYSRFERIPTGFEILLRRVDCRA